MIDDGSTDDSAKICNQYIQEDNRFKYFKKENGGQADARNFGIEHSNGEFIAFVDQDDLLHKDMYKTLMEDAITNNAKVSSVGYIQDYREYSEIIKTLGDYLNDSKLEIFNSSNEALIAVTRLENPMAGMIWNKIYSRDIIGSLRFDKDAPLVDDAKFSVYLFSKDFISTYRNVIMYHWVQHHTNQTTSSNFMKYYKAALTFGDLVIYTKDKCKEVNDKLINQYLQWLMMSYKRLYKSKKSIENYSKYKVDILDNLKKEKNHKYVLDSKHKLMYSLIINCRFIYNLLIKIGL